MDDCRNVGIVVKKEGLKPVPMTVAHYSECKIVKWLEMTLIRLLEPTSGCKLAE